MTVDTADISSQSDPKARFTLACLAMLLLAITPIIGVLAPRFMAYIPAIVGLMGMVWIVMETRQIPKFLRSSWVVPLAIIAVMAASALWALDAAEALTRTQKSAGVLLGFVLLFNFLRHVPASALEGFQRIFPIAALAAGVVMVIDLYTRGFFFNFTHAGAIEPLGNISLSTLNRGVIVSVISSMLALGILANSQALSSRLKNALVVGILLTLVALLIRTESQSVQLAYMMSALVCAVFPFVRTGFLCKGMAVFLVILLFGAPWLAIWMFQNFAPMVLDIEWFRTGYAPDRTEIWNFVARRALEQPWLGYGVEATRVIRDFETQQLFHKGTHVLHPHNFALQIWIEFGVFGIALLSGFLAYLLSLVEKMDKHAAHLALVSFVALVSIAATGYGFWQGWWLGMMIYVFCGVAIVQRITKADHLLGNKA